jgi:hypothetical protein
MCFKHPSKKKTWKYSKGKNNIVIHFKGEIGKKEEEEEKFEALQLESLAKNVFNLNRGEQNKIKLKASLWENDIERISQKIMCKGK